MQTAPLRDLERPVVGAAQEAPDRAADKINAGPVEVAAMPEPIAARQPIRTHVAEIASLAGPIAMGQLAKQLMQTATLILFGMIHPATLAAGGLAVRITVSTQILSAILLTVGVSVAVARGAGDARRISALYW